MTPTLCHTCANSTSASSCSWCRRWAHARDRSCHPGQQHLVGCRYERIRFAHSCYCSRTFCPFAGSLQHTLTSTFVHERCLLTQPCCAAAACCCFLFLWLCALQRMTDVLSTAAMLDRNGEGSRWKDCMSHLHQFVTRKVTQPFIEGVSVPGQEEPGLTFKVGS